MLRIETGILRKCFVSNTRSHPGINFIHYDCFWNFNQ